MSKVTRVGKSNLYNVDCGHILDAFDIDKPQVGDEVECPVCVKTEKQVTAARVEAYKDLAKIVNETAKILIEDENG